MYTLKVEGAFEAAHRVAGYPGKCDRLHGHNWVVEAVVKGKELDELGRIKYLDARPFIIFRIPCYDAIAA